MLRILARENMFSQLKVPIRTGITLNLGSPIIKKFYVAIYRVGHEIPHLTPISKAIQPSCNQ